MASIQKVELKVELENLFARARGEIFEDGMESEFSRNLVALIEKHQDIAIEALADLIARGHTDSEVASEALRWVGHIENPITHQARLALLEQSLSASSARIRDGALLGLASMDDPRAIRSLERAIDREEVSELRDDMIEILEQLREG